MSSNVTALTLIGSAALLAAWVDVRFPKLSPNSFVGVGLHMLASVFVLQLGLRVLGVAPREPAPVIAALLGVALPATLYMLLATFWLLKLLHGMMGRAVR